MAQIEQRKLLFDAAVESPVVLMAAAGGEDDAVGKAFQEAADGGGALRRLIEKIQAEFKESFAGLRLRVARVPAKLGTSGKPKAIQMRGSGLFCAMMQRRPEYHRD